MELSTLDLPRAISMGGSVAANFLDSKEFYMMKNESEIRILHKRSGAVRYASTFGAYWTYAPEVEDKIKDKLSAIDVKSKKSA